MIGIDDDYIEKELSVYKHSDWTDIMIKENWLVQQSKTEQNKSDYLKSVPLRPVFRILRKKVLKVKKVRKAKHPTIDQVVNWLLKIESKKG